MLKHFRNVGKAVVGFGLLCKLCWLVLVGAFALAAAVAVFVTGEFAHLPGLLLTVLLVGGVVTFLGWVARDAKQSGKALRRERRRRGNRRGGDIGDVAGIAPRDPWLG